MVANILPTDPHTRTPPPPLRMGFIGKNLTFSEHGITKCNNMVANILLTDHRPKPRPQGDRVKRSNSTFSQHGNVTY